MTESSFLIPQVWVSPALTEINPFVLSFMALASVVLASVVLASVVLASVVLASVVLASVVLASVVLASVVLASVVLAFAVLSSVVLSFVVLSSVVLAFVVLSSVVLAFAVLSSVVLAFVVLAFAVLSSVVLAFVVLSSVVLSLSDTRLSQAAKVITETKMASNDAREWEIFGFKELPIVAVLVAPLSRRVSFRSSSRRETTRPMYFRQEPEGKTSGPALRRSIMPSIILAL